MNQKVLELTNSLNNFRAILAKDVNPWEHANYCWRIKQRIKYPLMHDTSDVFIEFRFNKIQS